MLHVLLPLP